MRAFRITLVIMSLALILAACGRPGDTIRIGVRNANDHVPFYLADKQGLYRQQGLDVTVQVIPSNTEIVEALQRGDFQLGAVPVTTAIAAIDQGAELRIIAMTGRGSDGLLVRQDGGITTWADLKGKQIGTIRASILDVLLAQALEAHGLDPRQDVSPVYFQKLGDMISALKTGQIDAASNTEPFITEAERQGWGRILGYYTEQWPNHPCCVVIARKDFIQQHSRQVEAFLRGHTLAVEQANADPAFAAQVIVDTLQAFDPELVLASMAPEKMSLGYDLTAEEIEQMAALMRRQGLLEHDPAQLELVDLEPLQRALEARR